MHTTENLGNFNPEFLNKKSKGILWLIGTMTGRTIASVVALLSKKQKKAMMTSTRDDLDSNFAVE